MSYGTDRMLDKIGGSMCPDCKGQEKQINSAHFLHNWTHYFLLINK